MPPKKNSCSLPAMTALKTLTHVTATPLNQGCGFLKAKSWVQLKAALPCKPGCSLPPAAMIQAEVGCTLQKLGVQLETRSSSAASHSPRQCSGPQELLFPLYLLRMWEKGASLSPL